MYPIQTMFVRIRILPWKLLILISLTVTLLNHESTANDHNLDDFMGKEKNFVWDHENGYLFFCLCMGRIGNKIDHFLGGLAFAKSINRTLVLPPIRTYKNIPFDHYFQVEPLREYHRVITAADFLEHLAPIYWPPGERYGFCYGPPTTDQKKPGCQVKQGNPHKPFWDDMDIDFDEIVSSTLSYSNAHQWLEEYPASKYPVIAMRGAPAPYPIVKAHHHLQRYLQIATHIQEEAEHLISQKLPPGPFIGIHLRNGQDWVKACDYVKGTTKYMSSTQCTDGPATKEMCLPSQSTILHQLADIVERTNIKTVFVATDRNPMIAAIENHLKDQKVRAYHLDPQEPMVDQAILMRSQHFIGNCVSSFTSFVARTRGVQKLDTSFWGI